VTPLLLEERYYPLVECRLVWRRMVVAFTSAWVPLRNSSGACGASSDGGGIWELGGESE